MSYQAVLEALADPVRREILFQLHHGPASVGELALAAPVTRPAVSRHLRILEQAGLVAYEAHGTKNVYRLDRHGISELREWLEELDPAVAEDRGLALPPIRKRAVVPAAPGQAFEVFTAATATWWVQGNVAMECREGGAVTETSRGRSARWGTISAWQPPHSLTIEWHPGRPAAQSTEVEIRFAGAAGQTVVQLEHRGWERKHAPAVARADYEWGWDTVLAAYSKAVTKLVR
jgi:DNA-binding transcriptional ArsR family regulator